MWLVYAIAAVFAWGFWGFLAKIVVNDIGAIPGFIILGLSSGIFMLLLFSIHGLPSSLPRLPLYILTGLLGSVGALFFYLAMEKGNASVIVPISAQYIVVSAVLALLFLKEPMTAKKIVGILLGVGAIILLSA